MFRWFIYELHIFNIPGQIFLHLCSRCAELNAFYHAVGVANIHRIFSAIAYLIDADVCRHLASVLCSNLQFDPFLYFAIVAGRVQAIVCAAHSIYDEFMGILLELTIRKIKIPTKLNRHSIANEKYSCMRIYIFCPHYWEFAVIPYQHNAFAISCGAHHKLTRAIVHGTEHK